MGRKQNSNLHHSVYLSMIGFAQSKWSKQSEAHMRWQTIPSMVQIMDVFHAKQLSESIQSHC